MNIFTRTQLIPPSRNGRLIRTAPGAYNPMSNSMPMDYAGNNGAKQLGAQQVRSMVVYKLEDISHSNPTITNYFLLIYQ